MAAIVPGDGKANVEVGIYRDILVEDGGGEVGESREDERVGLGHGLPGVRSK